MYKTKHDSLLFCTIKATIAKASIFLSIEFLFLILGIWGI